MSEEAWPEVEEEDPERQDRRGAEEEEDEVRAEGDARGRPRIRFDEAGAAAAEEDYSPGTPVARDQQVGPPGGSQASATGARGSHEAATSPTQAGNTYSSSCSRGQADLQSNGGGTRSGGGNKKDANNRGDGSHYEVDTAKRPTGWASASRI